MNYRAACPHCASVFRLGDDQLAAAAGWVQCGVCGVAFDARVSLLMEDGSLLPRATDLEPSAPVLPDATPSAPEAEPEVEPAAALTEDNKAPETPADRADTDTDPSPPSADSDTATVIELPRGIHEREDPLDLPSIILIDPNLPSYDDPGPMPVIRPDPAQPPTPDVLPEIITSAPPLTNASPPAHAARIEYAQPAPIPAHRPRARRTSGPWLGGIAALLLALALIAQIAWFQRDTLATQFPALRPALEQACARLGCALSLPKQLDQIRIVGSDLNTEADGQLHLAVTLGNQARYAIAWPMLVLTLTDQAGKPLARRSFAPSEYLADTNRIAAGMPPLAEQALKLPLTVRDLAPMGFDLRLAY